MLKSIKEKIPYGHILDIAILKDFHQFPPEIYPVLYCLSCSPHKRSTPHWAVPFSEGHVLTPCECACTQVLQKQKYAGKNEQQSCFFFTKHKRQMLTSRPGEKKKNAKWPWQIFLWLNERLVGYTKKFRAMAKIIHVPSIKEGILPLGQEYVVWSYSSTLK